MAERKDFTQSVQLPVDTEFSASIAPESDKYIAGKLNITSGVLEHDVTIMATPAVLVNCTIYVKQYEHQHIIITTYDAEGNQLNTYDQAIINLRSGIRFSAKLIADEGYVKGILSHENEILILRSNRNIIAKTDAVPALCQIKVKPTIHQKITIVVDNVGVLESDTSSVQSITVPYWSTYKINIKSDTGYKAGNLNQSSQRKWTVAKVINGLFVLNNPSNPDDYTGTITISATAATPIIHKLYIKGNIRGLSVTTFDDNGNAIMTYTPDQVSFKLYDNTIYDGPLMLDIKTIQTTKINTLFENIQNVYTTNGTDLIIELLQGTKYTITTTTFTGYKATIPIRRFTDDYGNLVEEFANDSTVVYIIDRDTEIDVSKDPTVKMHMIRLRQTDGETIRITGGQYRSVKSDIELAYGETFTISAIANNTTTYKPGTVGCTSGSITYSHTTTAGYDVYTGTVTTDTTIFITAPVPK